VDDDSTVMSGSTPRPPDFDQFDKLINEEKQDENEEGKD